MENVYVLKCEKCSANLRYDADKQTWICEYCESEYNISDFDDKISEVKYSYKYTCPDCGAEIIVGQNTSATSCIYCGNTAILLDRISDIAEPQKIITFKISKESAKEHFIKYAKSKIFTDKNFITSLEDMSIEGVYTPFWVYAGDISGEKTFGKHNSVTIEYEGKLNKLPVDGIKSLANDEIAKIEPYNFKECKEFKKEYLSGFFADRYDFDAQSGIELINEEIQLKLKQRCNSKILIFIIILILMFLVIICVLGGYTSAQINTINIDGKKLLFSSIFSLGIVTFLGIFLKGVAFLNCKNDRFFYFMSEKSLVLLPLYIIKTKTAKSEYISLMNAQTGKIFCKITQNNKLYKRTLKNLKLRLKMKINVIHFVLDLLEECKRK